MADTGENKRAHLLMIQSVITRLADKSFLVKAASLSILSAFLGFTFEKCRPESLLYAMLASVGLWGLDTFFLHRERLFRRLYDAVRHKRHSAVDFSMDLDEVRHLAPGWRGVTFSPTLVLFHATIFLVALLGYLFGPAGPCAAGS